MLLYIKCNASTDRYLVQVTPRSTAVPKQPQGCPTNSTSRRSAAVILAMVVRFVRGPLGCGYALCDGLLVVSLICKKAG